MQFLLSFCFPEADEFNQMIAIASGKTLLEFQIYFSLFHWNHFAGFRVARRSEKVIRESPTCARP